MLLPSSVRPVISMNMAPPPNDEIVHVENVEDFEMHQETGHSLKVHAKTWIALAAINLISFAQIMSLVGAGLLAQTTTGLLGDQTKASWCGGILAIFTLALNPPLSQAADYWGRKWILVVCSASAFVGQLVVSRAHNIATLLVGFGFVGLAQGPQFCLYAVSSEILPRKYRALAQTTVQTSTGSGAIVSVLMGGALLRYGDLENYRIYFYVAAALYGLGTLGILFGYNPPLRELQQSFTTSQKLRSLDWIGILALTFGLTLFAVGLSFFGNPYSFKDATVLAPSAIGVMLLIALALYEWILKKDGILHHALFKHRNFVLAIVIIFAEGLAFFTFNSYFVFEQIVVLGSDSWSASLRTLLYYGTSIVLTIIAGVYTTWSKRLSDPLILGFALYTIFAALMTTVEPTTSEAAFCGYAVLAGVANGLILLNIVVAAQLATPRSMIAVTTGLLVAARGVGSMIGTVAIGAVLTNTLKDNLGPKTAAAVLPLGFPADEISTLIGALASGNQQALAHISGLTPQISYAAIGAVKDSYTLAFRNCWIVSAVFCAVAFVAACFIANARDEFTGHIDAPVEEKLVKS